MTGWHLGPMVAFDVETTGTDVETDRIVTITIATVGGDSAGEPWSALVAVDDIPGEATAIHGITAAHARDNGRPAAEVLDHAAGLLVFWLRGGNTPIVGMNLAFDLTILDRECRRWSVPTVEDRLDGKPLMPVVDVMVIDRALDRYRSGKRTLADLCSTYGVRHDGAHNATEDALAAARIAYRMGQMSHANHDELVRRYNARHYPREIARAWAAFGRLTLTELHHEQVRWYAEQTRSLEAYWRRLVVEAWDRADPEGDDRDERRGIAAQEVKELERRIDSLDPSWPIRTLDGES